MKECPHCGSGEGYYVKGYVRGSIETKFGFDGTYLEDGRNSGMYEGLTHEDGKYAYCRACHKRLRRVEEM